MGDSDILGAHGGGPNANFEEVIPNPARPTTDYAWSRADR
jgi:hypothetical protein